jgi:hypothetical protein
MIHWCLEAAMSGSGLVAGLFGLVLIGLALSDAAKLHIWANTLAPVAYLLSGVIFVGGLIIVLIHNRWTSGSRVLLTFLGWLAIVAVSPAISPSLVGMPLPVLSAVLPWLRGGGGWASRTAATNWPKSRLFSQVEYF